MEPDEKWLPITGYEGSYEVSNLGRVRSLDRIVSNGHRRPGVTLVSVKQPGGGYLIQNLWSSGASQMYYVHRLVLAAFVGPAPAGCVALHRDGDRTNAALSNLSWGTPSENQTDSVGHGTHRNASKQFCPSGHPYDEVNTYYRPGPNTHRCCRTCRRERLLNSRARKAA